jgi:REP element-mobilizing transposase RayT
MPDHVHLQLVGLSKTSDLQVLIRAFKGRSTVVARAKGIPNLWQIGFYDHLIRSGEAHGAVA